MIASRPVWVEGALIGLASRAFSVTVLFVAYLANLPRVSAYWPTPFEMWDGFWYSSIERLGYHADAVVLTPVGNGYHDFAFFPAWPAIVRIVSLNGLLPMEVVAPVLANVLFVIAAVLIFRVLDRLGGRSSARVGLVLFAFSPAGYVYSLDYAEPLFLVAAAAYFLTTSPARTAAAAALATITRLGGLALAAAALADLTQPETRRRGLATILAVVITFAAWWLFIAILTGDPLGYMQGSPAWFSVNPVPTQTGLAGIFGREQPGGLLTGIYLVLLGIGAARLIRSGRLPSGLYAAACIVSALLVNWSTMARLASVAFPAFVGLAELSSNRWYRPALLGTFVAAQVASIFLAELHLITP